MTMPTTLDTITSDTTRTHGRDYPAWIAKEGNSYGDDYAVWAYRAKGTGLDTYTAGELAEQFGEGKITYIWQFVQNRMLKDGTVQHVFCKHRVLVANGRLVGYRPDGSVVVVHPADRPLRIMTNRGV